MPSNKPVKTVQATCACGATFSREVKRGRPQVWCPACVLVPFYERTTTTTNATTPVVVGDVAPAPERIVNENDRLDYCRPEIEARMALINLAHKERFGALVLSGMDPFDAGTQAQIETFSATLNMYAELAPQFYKPGREIEDV